MLSTGNINNAVNREEMKRTTTDKLISLANSIRYAVTEPILLKIARLRFEHLHSDDGDNPLVTIYTPTFNRGKLLIERAVSSVLSQTYKNFEYVIVGDSCTDDTGELIRQVNDPRIRFHNIPKREPRYPDNVELHWLAGPVVPANQALTMVRGKWIARLDDDDIFTPDHIESLLFFARQENYEFVSAQYIEERFGVRKIIDGVSATSSYYNKRSPDPNDDSPKIGGTSTWLYRSYLRFFKYNINSWRKAWNRVNDIDLSLRFFRAGVRMGFLEKVLSYVIPRPGEVTIGMEAYRIAEVEKRDFYRFKD